MDFSQISLTVYNSVALNLILTLLIVLTLVSYEARNGCYKLDVHSWRDKIITFVSTLSLSFMVKPVIEILMAFLLVLFIPSHAGALSEIAFWPAFIIFFLIDDFVNYWVHRYAHTARWLWMMHRTHHTSTVMNTAVFMRSNIFYPFFLPQTWIGSVAIYLGLYEVYIAFLSLKILFNSVNHSEAFRWDQWMRERENFRPVIHVLERIIVTPSFHHVHHGYGKSSRPKGNYGSGLTCWDQIYGTAYYYDSLPEKWGLPVSGKLGLGEELFWPIIRNKKEQK